MLCGQVLDFVASVDLVQEYVHEGKWNADARFVLPLDTDAIVNNLVIEIGTRKVLGVVRGKQAARDQYDKARARGDAAVLVERIETAENTRDFSVMGACTWCAELYGVRRGLGCACCASGRAHRHWTE